MQELTILPTGASSFKEAMKMGVEVYHNLKAIITNKYGHEATIVVDEGGFAPNIKESKEGLELLKTAIENAGCTGKVVIGMVVAASEFYGEKDQTYDLNFKEENNDGSQKISGDSLTNLYTSLVREYPIVSIEHPFDQDDWVHYAKLTKEIGEQVQIAGDDLLVTNPTRVAKAITEKSCNALLLEVNHIGSVTESIDAVAISKSFGWGAMTCHRIGETEDTFIADLAVGLCMGQIKTGAPCRSEEVAKYNQLLRIEEELGVDAMYAGLQFRAPIHRIMNLDSDPLMADDWDLDTILNFANDAPVFNDESLIQSYENYFTNGEHHQTVEVNQSDGADNLIRSGQTDLVDHGIEDTNEDVSDSVPPLVQDTSLHVENEGNHVNMEGNALITRAAAGFLNTDPIDANPSTTEGDGGANNNTERNLCLITQAPDASQDGLTDTNQTHVPNEGSERNSDENSVEILRLPADFNGNAQLEGSQLFNIATAEMLRKAINTCKTWLPKHLLSALLSNASLFAVDSKEVREQTFKQDGLTVVIVLINAEFQKLVITQGLYSSRAASVTLVEHKSTQRMFRGTAINCYPFGGDLWRRRRFTLDNNEFHVLQWLPPMPPERSMSVVRVRGARETVIPSVTSCTRKLLELQDLTDEEIAKAANVMKYPDNREIFMSLGSNVGAQLIWLRNQIGLV